MEPHTDAPTPLRHRVTRAFLVLVTLVVCYVLSYGPAVVFLDAKFITIDANLEQTRDGPLAYFYMPVERVADETGFGQLLYKYCRWWQRIEEHFYHGG